VGSLAVNRLTYEGVKAGFQGKDGNVRVGPVEADFYGGRVAGESFVRTQARMAHDTTLAYKGFQVEPVMRNIFKEEEGLESIAGQAFLDLSLSGEGLSWYEQGRALQGSADFSIRKGSYRFFGQGGVKAAAPRDDEPAPGDNGKPNRTEFDEATATLDLKDGIVTNNDFQLKGLLVNAEGKGYADLRNREVDYGLDFRMTGMPTIPIRISGKLEDPSVGVQAGGILPRTLLRIPGSAFGLFRSILSLPFRALDLLGGDKDGEKTQ
jgi:AsmA protein